MHDDAQGICVIPHVAKGLVDLAGGAIGRLDVHPAHRIGGVAEALDDENLGFTFHPGAALCAGRPNGKAGVGKAGIDGIRAAEALALQILQTRSPSP